MKRHVRFLVLSQPQRRNFYPTIAIHSTHLDT
jgi:hypothetical protein